MAYRLWCECGYEVRCEIMRYGVSLSEIVFFDDTEASTTWGERVHDCPGCHGHLGLSSVRS